MPSSTYLVECIRLAPKERDLSKRELADRPDVSESLVSRWLSGERDLSTERLAEIVSAFDLTWSEFYLP